MKSEVQRLMPVAFLGPRDGQEPPAHASTPAVSQSTNGTGNSALIAKLETLTRATDQGKFQEAAMKMEEVVASPDVLSQVLDDSPNGIWAKSQASA